MDQYHCMVHRPAAWLSSIPSAQRRNMTLTVPYFFLWATTAAKEDSVERCKRRRTRKTLWCAEEAPVFKKPDMATIGEYA